MDAGIDRLGGAWFRGAWFRGSEGCVSVIPRGVFPRFREAWFRGSEGRGSGGGVSVEPIPPILNFQLSILNFQRPQGGLRPPPCLSPSPHIILPRLTVK